MLYSYQDLIDIYGSDYQIKKMLKDRKIFKIELGLYSNRNAVDVLEALMFKRKDVVLTLQSAFYHYGLTDYIPEFIYVATPRNAYPINNKKVKQIFMSSKYHEIGKIKIKKNDYEICIYDLERCLIELIRYETKIPFEEYNHVLKKFRKIKDKLDFYKIGEYAKHFKSYKKIVRVVQMAVI